MTWVEGIYKSRRGTWSCSKMTCMDNYYIHLFNPFKYCNVIINILFSLVDSFRGSLQNTSEDLGIGLSADTKNINKIQKGQYFLCALLMWCLFEGKKSHFIVPAHGLSLHSQSRVFILAMLQPKSLSMPDAELSFFNILKIHEWSFFNM